MKRKGDAFKYPRQINIIFMKNLLFTIALMLVYTISGAMNVHLVKGPAQIHVEGGTLEWMEGSGDEWVTATETSTGICYWQH